MQGAAEALNVLAIQRRDEGAAEFFCNLLSELFVLAAALPDRLQLRAGVAAEMGDDIFEQKSALAGLASTGFQQASLLS